jgi:hypothetical protein
MGRCFTCQAFAAILLAGLAGVCSAQGTDDAATAEALRSIGVAPTKEGVAKFLDAVAKGDRGSPSADATVKLVADLGDDDFDTREKATGRLSEMLFPPAAELESVAKGTDPEASRRARRVLAHLSSRPDPVVALFKAVRAKSIPITPSRILPVISRCEMPAALEAAQDAFVAGMGKDDLKMARELAGDKDPRVRVAAIRSLGAIRKEEAFAELEKHLASKDGASRGAAARALGEAVGPGEARKHAAKLDAVTAALVLRSAEWRFRQVNKDRRGVAGVMDEYHKLLDDYALALEKAKDIKREKKGQQNTEYWLKLGLDTSKHPEVLMYRIRWFSGSWSAWYVPGFNDREVGKGRDIRMWGCFNDHEYEVVTAADKAKHRAVLDLP